MSVLRPLQLRCTRGVVQSLEVILVLCKLVCTHALPATNQLYL